MIDTMIKIFSYSFSVRALVVGILISLCAALIGVSLVLKRYSMIGDGLSHVGFGALSAAMVLNIAPMALSVPVIIVAALFLLKLNERGHLKGDCAIALLSVSCLAIGVILTSLSKGSNVDIESYLFGSVVSVKPQYLYISIALAAAVIIIYMIFYNHIFSVTFDECFAKATGTNVSFFNSVLAVLCALVIAVGMRIMGTMLITGLIIFPALSAMSISKSFKKVTFISAVISVICFFAGFVLSFEFNTPPGASVIVVNLFVYIICRIVRKFILNK